MMSYKLSPIQCKFIEILVAVLTQAMYAYRIQVLSRLKYVSWGIMAVRKSTLIYHCTNNLVI